MFSKVYRMCTFFTLCGGVWGGVGGVGGGGQKKADRQFKPFWPQCLIEHLKHKPKSN